MKRYRNFLELGTGWGCTAFLVASAMKENGIGKCITYDNGQDYENVRYPSFINQMINEFGLSEHIDFRNQNIVLDNITGQSFDCIFSDFDRSVAFIDKFIGWSLFNVNDHSSIFIDGLCDYYEGYYYTKLLVDMLNRNTLPKSMIDSMTGDVHLADKFVREHSFSLTTIRKCDKDKSRLVNNKDRTQNGMCWIKIEPNNIRFEILGD